MGEPVTVKYTFTMNDGSYEIFNIKLDPDTLDSIGDTPDVLPEWTKLEFHKCPHCPLIKKTYCPLAVSLISIVNKFNRLISYDKIHLDVETKERFISQNTTAQKGISALMGLVIASSGCPHTNFLKPMARFHLPLASREETMYRATSMYMLGQYFLSKNGQPVDFEFKGLIMRYRKLEEVNIAIAERLNIASKSDSAVNALILLDIYNKTLPMAIDSSLEQLRYLYRAFFPEKSPEDD
ncbi:hypothetical protein JXQ31_21055 [candidate division KSB1 bacterium]|nr:hypothetical protein [candidate division KSB1 bacterium]